MKIISISLPENLIEKVDLYVKSSGRTRSALIKILLERELSNNNSDKGVSNER
jgi:metal-responsive CopG/Arc/MetJ family transcriptional regulator